MKTMASCNSSLRGQKYVKPVGILGNCNGVKRDFYLPHPRRTSEIGTQKLGVTGGRNLVRSPLTFTVLHSYIIERDSLFQYDPIGEDLKIRPLVSNSHYSRVFGRKTLHKTSTLKQEHWSLGFKIYHCNGFW